VFSLFGARVSLISAGLTVRNGTGAAPFGITSLMLWLLFMYWGIIKLAFATSTMFHHGAHPKRWKELIIKAITTLSVKMISNILNPVEIDTFLKPSLIITIECLTSNK
jgi:hypothetical protein